MNAFLQSQVSKTASILNRIIMNRNKRIQFRFNRNKSSYRSSITRLFYTLLFSSIYKIPLTKQNPKYIFQITSKMGFQRSQTLLVFLSLMLFLCLVGARQLENNAKGEGGGEATDQVAVTHADADASKTNPTSEKKIDEANKVDGGEINPDQPPSPFPPFPPSVPGIPGLPVPYPVPVPVPTTPIPIPYPTVPIPPLPPIPGIPSLPIPPPPA